MKVLQKAARAERVRDVELDSVLEAAEVVAEQLSRPRGLSCSPAVRRSPTFAVGTDELENADRQ